MSDNYLIHTKNGSMIITRAEAIENALQQEASGIKASYVFYDYKNKKALTSPGWLVWSTWADGCGVVARRADGYMYVVTGWQGDFCHI